jgi:hypothetical protein
MFFLLPLFTVSNVPPLFLEPFALQIFDLRSVYLLASLENSPCWTAGGKIGCTVTIPPHSSSTTRHQREGELFKNNIYRFQTVADPRCFISDLVSRTYITKGGAKLNLNFGCII